MPTKIVYIAGLVSAVGLAVMVLTGMTSIADILERERELVRLCPWCM